MEFSGRIVDLTMPLDENAHCFPDDPPYIMTRHTKMEIDDYNLSKLEMGAHSGSHVDAPLHFIENGLDITSLPLECFIGPAVAIDCPKEPGETVRPKDLDGADIREHDIVLFRTGWEERSCTPRFFDLNWPALSVEVVEALITKKVRATGGDIASADNCADIKAGPVAHRKALGAGIPIYEALINMKEVVGRRFTFIGLPLKLVGCEASPVRAIAILDS